MSDILEVLGIYMIVSKRLTEKKIKYVESRLKRQ